MTSQPPQVEVEEVARALNELERSNIGTFSWEALDEMEREGFREEAQVAIATIDRLRRAAPAAEGWRPIETADFDGSPALVYRPLARASHDEPVAIKRLIGGHHRCWAVTVPKGTKPFNPTDGLCHVTHFMPIPTPPKDETHG